MKIIKPPSSINMDDPDRDELLFVFLGGSIEMGSATLWQDEVCEKLSDIERLIILNPRRDSWDSSWMQDPTPGTPFHEQVSWELNGQDSADIIVYYFDGNTKSPITLLELGLYAANPDIQKIVYCPTDFWRYGNVKIVCDTYGIDIYEDREQFFDSLRSAIVSIETLI